MNIGEIRQKLPAIGYHHFHDDPNINYQFNRFLIPSEIEAYKALGKRVVNFDDWYKEFLSLAQLAERNDNFTHAIEYFRAAEFFLAAGAPERKQVYEKYIECFRRIHPDVTYEAHKVPYANGFLHCLRVRCLNPKGTIIVHAGYDAYIEEFFGIAQLMSELSYEIVMFDGPGQGSTLMKYGLAMTPDWESPTKTVLDFFALQNVTLVGISLGGYLALRAAAFDTRIKRVVAYDVMYDFFDCITSRRGPFLQWVLKVAIFLKLNPFINFMSAIKMKSDLLFQWGVQQGMHIFDAKTPAQFFSALKNYTTAQISKKVHQDVLLMAGAEDHFVPLSQLYLQMKALTAAKSVTARIFTRSESAQSHCQFGNIGLATETIIRWIEGCS